MIDFKKWLIEVKGYLEVLTSLDLGYPQNVNEVRAGSVERNAELPKELQTMFQAFDGLNLPDVHVGYFIDSTERVLSASKRGVPSLIEDERSIRVQVFGSDGGGSLFALGLDDGAVYYLPCEGAVKDGKFYGSRSTRARLLAANMSEFLERLKEDLKAFVQGDNMHKYMV